MEWKPCGAATLIGSMPHRNRDYVIDLILERLHEVPVWPQLTTYMPEQMMNQYLEGLPGWDPKTMMGQNVIFTDSDSFDDDIYKFYSEYFDVVEGQIDIKDSRFQFGPETGKTLLAFIERLSDLPNRSYKAIKGQVVGPFTLLSSLKAPNGRLLLYDDRMFDLVPKHLAMKALWQAKWFKTFAERVIIFFDEPALSGFGSSAFIGVSKEHILRLFDEIYELLNPHGVLIGVHVCANTDWSLLLTSKIDIVNCDAYNYGDKFCIYNDDIRLFISRGGVVAWGLIPTDDPTKIGEENDTSLVQRLLKLWEKHFNSSEIGTLLTQSMITPSCGCGTLSDELAERVVEMTVSCSEGIRKLCEGMV
ncbi:MAG: hypothetical protein N2260_07640 [Syntrophobacterales bacterium]|nr:hypothetical protein [Syntrophobacterales bacterium]